MAMAISRNHVNAIPEIAPKQIAGRYGKECFKDVSNIITDKFYKKQDGSVGVVPAAYQYNKLAKHMLGDTAYLLTPEEVTRISTSIQKVLREGTYANANVPGVGPFMQTEQIGMGMTDFKWYKWLDIPPPEFTQTGEGGSNVQPLKVETVNELWGMHYDWSLKRVELDALNSSMAQVTLPNQQTDMMMNIMESLARYRDWYIYRGTDVVGVKPLGITGLINDPDLTATGLNGTDITGVGSAFDLAVDLANFLIENLHDPPFVLDMSHKVMARANKNRNATSDKTDMQLIREYTGESGTSPIFNVIRTNRHIIDTLTEVSGNGAMIAYAPQTMGRRNFFLAESYPTAAYPLPPQGWAGIDFKFFWMGRTIVQRPSAIAVANSLVTA